MLVSLRYTMGLFACGLAVTGVAAPTIQNQKHDGPILLVGGSPSPDDATLSNLYIYSLRDPKQRVAVLSNALLLYDAVASPDNSRIAFVALSDRANNSTNLFVYDRASRTTTPVTRYNSNIVVGYPRWSPDGKSLLYQTMQSKTATAPALYSISADGTKGQWLAQGTGGAWSPDETQIFFFDGKGQPRLLRRGEKASRPLTTAFKPNAQYSSGVWSPDGQKIALALQTGKTAANKSGSYPTYGIYIVNAKTGAVERQLIPPAQQKGLISGLVWSPERNGIYYTQTTMFLLGVPNDSMIRLVGVTDKRITTIGEGITPDRTLGTLSAYVGMSFLQRRKNLPSIIVPE